MNNVVFVLDTNKRPMTPYSPARARQLMRQVVPMGKRKGTHVGRLLCRASGSFDISTNNGRAAGISHRYCRILQRRSDSLATDR